jgi:hypothetical protein
MLGLAGPILKTLLLAGIPFVLLVFGTQEIIGFKPLNEPAWFRGFMIASFALMVCTSVWWYWIAPRADYLIVYERGFRWRLWLCRLGVLSARGRVATATIDEAAYRDDSLESEPVEVGATPAELLGRIRLELEIPRDGLALRCKSGKRIVLNRLLSRFSREDMVRFLMFLEKNTPARRIHVCMVLNEPTNTGSAPRK